ncbi:nucleotidyltransferase domain-containing protein [Saccharolobus islandicus]|uniref:DNA polymerase, beta domain protein region n=1 Tax=Saccharolobus islandicus (strain L.D.8.5 / Lassen \|nr:nucleotidyltransferase domain-containing protein [Sulfolobus islandicus]ADB86745.1 DNA polymerase, beta domain protein region [Sulfolobus islandicus L.D.8.5]
MAERIEYFKNWRKYAEEICISLKKILPDVMVVVFGSVIRGDYVPSLSDIDVLVVSNNVGDIIWQAKMNLYINSILKSDVTPFEFHYSNWEDYEEFYKKFFNPKIEIRC